MCFLSSLRYHDALFGDPPIYLACVARSSSWPSNSTSDLTLSSICSTDLSALEEFPDDVPVVISLYDLLEALASRNSSCRPHLVLSNDIQPHLRGVPPVLYDLLEALAFRNSSCRFLLVNDIQTHLRGVPPVYASIALLPSAFPATSTPVPEYAASSRHLCPSSAPRPRSRSLLLRTAQNSSSTLALLPHPGLLPATFLTHGGSRVVTRLARSQGGPLLMDNLAARGTTPYPVGPVPASPVARTRRCPS